MMSLNRNKQDGQPWLSVVTGGASGIGLACVQALLARGDRVVVLDLAGKDQQLGDLASSVIFHACDVSDEQSVRAVAASVAERLGPVGNLVNSAGIIQQRSSPEALDLAVWDKIVSVDQRGTYLCCVAFGGQMARSGGGSIVNIASITGSRSVPLHAYAPAKAAVISMSQCLAAEWGRSGVRVNSVSPGYTLTPALQDAIDKGDRDPADLIRTTALGRMVYPQEIADAVEFLTSSRASAITGIDLPVDAGWLAGTPWLTYGGMPDARTDAGSSAKNLQEDR
ncbi:Short-chain dehydrogenase/reductase SDR [Pusillimonas sp. T7-7]|uniref:SDR family NAD(P)-dependent oxidoreductase n=1 Tax=Pusillimonas sp. (strain T7-7) TaxID=1007105 RepID=UPI0002084E1A|nr:SDR family oxidoreductase [Pusillimonas sp. T7-7]AEC21176.1 Short-chain dehydrogenase/reductase SDR [Pusillimonas sp. T7-7]